MNSLNSLTADEALFEMQTEMQTLWKEEESEGDSLLSGIIPTWIQSAPRWSNIEPLMTKKVERTSERMA